MAEVVIYEMVHSPYCIPITEALRALDVPFRRMAVPPHDRSEVIRLSQGAAYQVPLLLHGSRAVFETGAETLDVARYVDKTFARGRLFPKAIEAPHLCTVEFIEDRLEGVGFKLQDPFYVDSITDLVACTMTIRHKERRFGRGCVDQWRDELPERRKELDRLLERFELTLTSQEFLFGATPVYADFALAGVLGNVMYGGHHTLSSRQKALASWLARLQAFRFAAAPPAR